MHRYLVRLENSQACIPRDAISLLIELRKSSSEFGSVVKNLRVTEKAIEFDLYVSDTEAKRRTIAKLETQFGRVLSERDLQSTEEAPQQQRLSIEDKMQILRQSVEMFNEQRYWECHETLEQMWRREPRGPEKDVQQGLILAASALVHFEKNEQDVCLGMIPRTLQKLEKWPDKMYHFVDIDHLKEELRNMEKNRVIRPFKL